MQIQIEANPGETAVSEVSTMRIINMIMMTVMLMLMKMMKMMMLMMMMMMMIYVVAMTITARKEVGLALFIAQYTFEPSAQ